MSVAVGWTPTTLGVDFGYYSVWRQHPTIADFFQQIYRIEDESIDSAEDHEARCVPESYQVLVTDADGITSVPLAAVTATSVAGSQWAITSNVDPTINRLLRIGRPLNVQLPDRAEVTSAYGRDGQQIYRSTEKLGETMDWLVRLDGADSRAMWDDLVTQMRRPDLPYVCVLDIHGNRWHAGLLPSAVPLDLSNLADLSAQMIDVGDTPTVVTLTVT